MGRRCIDDCLNEIYELTNKLDVIDVNYTKWYGYTVILRTGMFYADTFIGIKKALINEKKTSKI